VFAKSLLITTFGRLDSTSIKNLRVVWTLKFDGKTRQGSRQHRKKKLAEKSEDISDPNVIATKTENIKVSDSRTGTRICSTFSGLKPTGCFKDQD